MRLLFTGDCTLFAPQDFIMPDNLAIKQQDYAICNLEGALPSHDGQPIQKAGPHVQQAAGAVEAVQRAGFRVAALANNHIMDYGLAPFRYTLEQLNSQGLLYMGAGQTMAEAYAPLILQKDKEKVAVFNVAESEFGIIRDKSSLGGYAWILHPGVYARISALKQQGLYVIIYAHAGLECQPFPLEEWQQVYRSFIDAGADVVIASHPHIIQGYEDYQGRRIWYSLGNFFFDSPQHDVDQDIEWNRGLVLYLDTESGQQQAAVVRRTQDGLCKMPQEYTDKLLWERCSRIQEDSLAAWTDEVAEQCWQAYYRDYYLATFPMGLRDMCKNILKRIMRQPAVRRVDDTFLLHNIGIDTHRFIVQRVLYHENLRQNHLARV